MSLEFAPAESGPILSPWHEARRAAFLYWGVNGGARLGWWFSYFPDGVDTRKIIPIFGPSICPSSGGGAVKAYEELAEFWSGHVLIFPPPPHAPIDRDIFPCPYCADQVYGVRPHR